MQYLHLQLARLLCVLVLQHPFWGDHFLQDEGLAVVGYLEAENVAILRWEQKVKSGLEVTQASWCGMLHLNDKTAAS